MNLSLLTDLSVDVAVEFSRLWWETRAITHDLKTIKQRNELVLIIYVNLNDSFELVENYLLFVEAMIGYEL